MYVFAIFSNRNETMQFVNDLKRHGINSMIVSTPKGLGSSCSISAKFYLKDVEKAKSILRMGCYNSFSNLFKLKTKDNHAVFEIMPLIY